MNDWVGRCIAESRTAAHTRAVTLTYGRGRANDVDHERASVLTYSDVQKYLKLLRRHGYPVRYLVTGEYGSMKGRAHWHIVLFFKKDMPQHELDTRAMQDEWPHGYSFWTTPSVAAIKYNCKYILKDMGDDQRQGHLSMSRMPPLGAKYFQTLAELYVEQGLSPQDLFYSFPEVRRRKKDGSEEAQRFILGGRSAELFLEHYLWAWRHRHGDKEWPSGELVRLFFEYGKVVVDEGRITPSYFGQAKFDAMERRSREADAAIARSRLATVHKTKWRFFMDADDFTREIDERTNDGSIKQQEAVAERRQREHDDFVEKLYKQTGHVARKKR